MSGNEIRKIYGEVELPDITVYGQDSRVGDQARAQTVKHIQWMEQLGYLPPDEANKRIEHAAKAECSKELKLLTSDLPAYKDERAFWQKFNWDNPYHFLPVLLSGLALSITMAVLPGTILGAEHEFDTALGQALFIPFLIVGVMGIIVSIVMIGIKTDD